MFLFFRDLVNLGVKLCIVYDHIYTNKILIYTCIGNYVY